MKKFSPPKAMGPVASGAVVMAIHLVLDATPPPGVLRARVIYRLLDGSGKPLRNTPQTLTVTAAADVVALASKLAAGDLPQAITYAEGLLG